MHTELNEADHLSPSYFRLVKKVATGHIFDELNPSRLRSARTPGQKRRPSSIVKIIRTLRNLRRPCLTLCGEASIDFLAQAMETVLNESVPGDFIETGVWRGGIPLLIRAYLHDKGVKDRSVWLSDSFAGLPTDWKEVTHPMDRLASLVLGLIGQLAVSEEEVKNSFRYFGLLDQQVQFLPGWFRDTLHKLPKDQRFALVRLDGDYYESTRDALNALYPRVPDGGFIIIDDYHLPFGCKKAVDEFRATHSISSPLVKINGQSVYWRKEGP